MAITNHERVGKALELLRAGLAPFVEREFKSLHQAQAADAARRYLGDDRTVGKKPLADWDVAALLKLMWDAWNDVFGKTLGRAERSLVQELRDCRNKWAHQEPFSSDDADRALDSMARLLTAVSAPQADEVDKMKMELRRLIFDEQVRSEKRKAGGSLIESRGDRHAQALARGGHAARRRGERPLPAGRVRRRPLAGAPRRRHRTSTGSPRSSSAAPILTESLKRLLVGGVQRIAGKGGDPVVQLQTNFGGGKTHSMLALYHLFSGASAERAGRRRRGARRGGREEPAHGASAWCWWATRSRPAIPSPSRTARWCARCGASWPGSSAARRPSRASRPTTRRPRAPATCCASCSTSTGRA